MDTDPPRAVAVVLAGGSGTRLGLADGRNKVYLPLGGLPLLAWSLRTLDRHPLVDRTVLVLRAGDEVHAHDAVAAAGLTSTPTIVRGGPSRSASEAAGVTALGDLPAATVVLIHDGARPFVPTSLVTSLVVAAGSHGAAIPGLPLDPATVHIDGAVLRPLDRERLRRVQTPQAFTAGVLLPAYERAARDGVEGLDTAELVAAAGGPPARVVDGDRSNIKVTTPGDVTRAEAIASAWRS